MFRARSSESGPGTGNGFDADLAVQNDARAGKPTLLCSLRKYLCVLLELAVQKSLKGKVLIQFRPVQTEG